MSKQIVVIEKHINQIMASQRMNDGSKNEWGQIKSSVQPFGDVSNVNISTLPRHKLPFGNYRCDRSRHVYMIFETWQYTKKEERKRERKKGKKKKKRRNRTLNQVGWVIQCLIF